MIPRYKNLTIEIDNCKPTTIVEIGTWNGHNAYNMIRTAQNYSSDVIYHGFDAFGDMDTIISEKEKHVKDIIHDSNSVEDHLKSTGAKIILHKGYTKDTLPLFIPETSLDFVFIDGGHSLDTIENDWFWINKLINVNTVVLFDDCYVDNFDEGCLLEVSRLKNNPNYIVEFLDPVDVLKPWQIEGVIKIMMVKVKRRF